MVSEDSKYRRRRPPATLNDGAGKLTDYATLPEAVLAWRALPSAQKIRATVKMIGGPVYTAHQIDRLHYGRPTPGSGAAPRHDEETAPLQLPHGGRGADDLAHELSEFGYRETDDPTRPTGGATTRSSSGIRPSSRLRRFSTPATIYRGPGHVCRVEGAPAPRALSPASDHPRAHRWPPHSD